MVDSGGVVAVHYLTDGLVGPSLVAQKKRHHFAGVYQWAKAHRAHDLFPRKSKACDATLGTLQGFVLCHSVPALMGKRTDGEIEGFTWDGFVGFH